VQRTHKNRLIVYKVLIQVTVCFPLLQDGFAPPEEVDGDVPPPPNEEEEY